MLLSHTLLVPHLPTLVIDEHRGHQTPMLDALRAASARLLAEDPEVIVVLSASWMSSGPFEVGDNRRHTTLTDYSGFGVELRYDCPGNPGLARALVDAGVRARVRVGPSRRGVDSGVTVPLHFLAPRRMVPVVPLSIAGADAGDARVWGAVIRRTLEGWKKRVAFLVGGLVSFDTHAWSYHREMRGAEEFDRGTLDRMARGEWTDLLASDARTVARMLPEGGFRHIEVLRGFLGEDVAGVVHAYESSPGAGAALVEFSIPGGPPAPVPVPEPVVVVEETAAAETGAPAGAKPVDPLRERPRVGVWRSEDLRRPRGEGTGSRRDEGGPHRRHPQGDRGRPPRDDARRRPEGSGPPHRGAGRPGEGRPAWSGRPGAGRPASGVPRDRTGDTARPRRSEGPPRPGGPRTGPPRLGGSRVGGGYRSDVPPRSSGPRTGPPRSGPPRSSGPRTGPPRSGGSRVGGGYRSDVPPRSGAPRTGGPRTGPPRSGGPRTGPPRSREGGEYRSGPPRSSGPRTGPPRSSGPRTGPPRSGGPRTGPPRTGGPRTGPPRSREGGEYRSGPPRTGGPRTGPPRSSGPRTGPPRSGGPRTGPPRTGGPRTGPPRSSSPRTGPPRTGGPRTGPPRSGGPRTGPPRSGGPRTGPPRSGGTRGGRSSGGRS